MTDWQTKAPDSARNFNEQDGLTVTTLEDRLKVNYKWVNYDYIKANPGVQVHESMRTRLKDKEYSKIVNHEKEMFLVPMFLVQI